jgi:hypothetical protein
MLERSWTFKFHVCVFDEGKRARLRAIMEELVQLDPAAHMDEVTGVQEVEQELKDFIKQQRLQVVQ